MITRKGLHAICFSGLCTFLLMQILSCTTATTERKNESSDTPTPAFWIDTVTTFNPNTYEETTVIYQVPADLGWLDKNKPINAQIKNNPKDYSLDTVTIYDRETYKVIMTRITLTRDK